jgi:hypothetical protein
VTRVPYREHVPRDVTVQIFWPKNRDSEHWRDAWQVDVSRGKYVLSETPMTEDQWLAERATRAGTWYEDIHHPLTPMAKLRVYIITPGRAILALYS